ncbi:MAG: HEAT repeat domain-containing protein [Lysobacterales bacterium]
MKSKWIILPLLIWCSHGWAQAGALYNARVIENLSLTNPAKVMETAQGEWLAFSIPVLADTRSSCCWSGKWNRMVEVGCSLETRHQSYGSRSDSPLTENLLVFSQISAGKVKELRVFGESCPVDANGAQVTWIGNVGETEGLDWLENAVRNDGRESAGDSALMALALHRSPEAGQRLYTLAKDSGSEHAETAIFWLGDSRGEQGFRMLKQLLVELPKGERRREICFALAQNKNPAAADLLFQISKSDPDPEQRGQAMFWLAEEFPQQAQDWLLEVIHTEPDADVLDQAVFAISQLPDDTGDRILLDLARDGQTPRAVRRQALFWLAQSDNDASIAALAELLTR